MQFTVDVIVSEAIDKIIEDLDKDIEKYNGPENSIYGKLNKALRETREHMLAAKKAYSQGIQ
jgi:hypothetical protein